MLGFDLIFWDANREETGIEFEANTRKLIKAYQDEKIPMITGNVPIDVKVPDERTLGPEGKTIFWRQYAHHKLG